MTTIQLISLVVSLVFLGVITYFVYCDKIEEEYSILWYTGGILLVIFSLWRQGLEIVAKVLGIYYPPSLLLLVLVFSVFFILIEISVVLTKLKRQLVVAIQEISLLKLELEKKSKESTIINSPPGGRM